MSVECKYRIYGLNNCTEGLFVAGGNTKKNIRYCNNLLRKLNRIFAGLEKDKYIYLGCEAGTMTFRKD